MGCDRFAKISSPDVGTPLLRCSAVCKSALSGAPLAALAAAAAAALALALALA